MEYLEQKDMEGEERRVVDRERWLEYTNLSPSIQSPNIE